MKWTNNHEMSKFQKKQFQQGKRKWGWESKLRWFIFLFMSFAKYWHIAGMNLKCIHCQQL